MAGLIFGAIAGGLSGLGKAGQQAFASLGEAERQKQLEKMRANMMLEKQLRLQESSQQFQQGLESQRAARDDARAIMQNEWNRARDSESRAAAAEAQAAQNEFTRGENEKNRAVDRERIAAAEASRQNERFDTDAQGNVVRIVDGKATPVIDETTGKPLNKGRGLSEGFIKGAMAQIEAAHKVIGNVASTPEDVKVAQATVDELSAILMASGKSFGTPNKESIAALKASIGAQDEPVQKALFDARYGEGAAARILGTSQQPAQASQPAQPDQPVQPSQSTGIAQAAMAPPVAVQPPAEPAGIPPATIMQPGRGRYPDREVPNPERAQWFSARFQELVAARDPEALALARQGLARMNREEMEALVLRKAAQ